MSKSTVKLGEEHIEIAVPDPVVFFRVWSAPGSDYPTKAASILRLSWRGKNRPAHDADATQVERTGERVIRELLERGVPMQELDLATTQAYMLSLNHYLSGVEDVASDADFSEPEEGGLEST